MKKLNYHFILKMIGFLLIIESVFMLIATALGFLLEESAAKGILYSASITLLVGICATVWSRGHRYTNVGKREGFLSVTLAWLSLSLFGMLPYVINGAIPHIPDAFFETVSGFTTTGSTILYNIESFPKCLLFWRSFTQWIGGIGIIVFAMTFLPMFGYAAVHLFDAEVSGIMQTKITPRVGQLSKRIAFVYIIFSIIGVLLLWGGPMDLFDSACHAMTAISTGGFSTREASVAAFNSSYIEYVITFLMFIGGTNFTLFVFAIYRRALPFHKDEEFRWYVYLLVVVSLLIALLLLFSGRMTGVEYTFRTSLFQVVSVMTTTGFFTYDYVLWGDFYIFIFLFLMLFCACAGSTSGGMKVSRLVVLTKNAIAEFRRQAHPNAVLPVKLNNNVLPMAVVTKILAFVFLYLAILVFSFFILSLSGMEFSQSIGASISSLSNVGPGLGPNGPSGTFANVSDFAKVYMSILMIIGRLEIFTVLSLFIPGFWK